MVNRNYQMLIFCQLRSFDVIMTSSGEFRFMFLAAPMTIIFSQNYFHLNFDKSHPISICSIFLGSIDNMLVFNIHRGGNTSIDLHGGDLIQRGHLKLPCLIVPQPGEVRFFRFCWFRSCRLTNQRSG